MNWLFLLNIKSQPFHQIKLTLPLPKFIMSELQHWYQSWFNTKYYHQLYQHRNDEEAAFFLDKLCAQLQLKSDARLWDMACGKGRHAAFLAQKNYSVLGSDLSEQSIVGAQKNVYSNLDFAVHDMRNPIRINYFDCVLNIFTSLGYFENTRSDERVFSSAYQACNKNGIFVVDFMNVAKAEKKLVETETKNIDNIIFHIHKKIENKTFIKEISFRDNNKDFCFEERVRAYTRTDLCNLAEKAGFQIKNIFGDYALNNFSENDSDRLILILQK